MDRGERGDDVCSHRVVRGRRRPAGGRSSDDREFDRTGWYHRRHTADRPTPIGLGPALELGTHRFEITPDTYGHWVLLRDTCDSVLDSGRRDEAPLLGSDPMGDWSERDTARSADGRVETAIGRQFLILGGGHPAMLAPTDFLLTPMGQPHHVLAWDRIEHANTHHNWVDEPIATTDSFRIRRRQLDFDSQAVHVERLSATADLLAEIQPELVVP